MQYAALGILIYQYLVINFSNNGNAQYVQYKCYQVHCEKNDINITSENHRYEFEFSEDALS